MLGTTVKSPDSRAVVSCAVLRVTCANTMMSSNNPQRAMCPPDAISRKAAMSPCRMNTVTLYRKALAINAVAATKASLLPGRHYATCQDSESDVRVTEGQTFRGLADGEVDVGRFRCWVSLSA